MTSEPIAVEPVEEAAKLGWSHALGDPRRTADVGEEQADRDLRSCQPLLAEVLDAVRADRRIARKASEAEMSQHARRRYPRMAPGTACSAGEAGKRLTTFRKRAQPGVLTGQDPAELVVRRSLSTWLGRYAAARRPTRLTA